MDAPSSPNTVVMPIFLPMRPFMTFSSRFLPRDCGAACPKTAEAAGGRTESRAEGLRHTSFEGPRLLTRGNFRIKLGKAVPLREQAAEGKPDGMAGAPERAAVGGSARTPSGREGRDGGRGGLPGAEG